MVIGDRVYQLDGSTATVIGFETEKLDELVLVYNIEVDNFHSYFVGDTPVLVHNYKKCNDVKGGAYGDVGANGGEVHHSPAKSVSPFSSNAGPSLQMDAADHKLTASWGNSLAAQEFRAQQEYLISQGLFREAQQMDIVDIYLKFGSKYDEGIKQMKEYTNKLFNYNIW